MLTKTPDSLKTYLYFVSCWVLHVVSVLMSTDTNTDDPSMNMTGTVTCLCCVRVQHNTILPPGYNDYARLTYAGLVDGLNKTEARLQRDSIADYLKSDLLWK